MSRRISPFLFNSPIPTGQEPALRTAEQNRQRTTGSIVRSMVDRGEVTALSDFEKAERRMHIARVMIDGFIGAHLDRFLADPHPRTDPLAAFRKLMFYTVGHQDRWQRYDVHPPLLSVTGRGHRGQEIFFSHAVASMIDWPTSEAVIIAKAPDVPDTHPEDWFVLRHNLMNGHSRREELTQVEKGADGDVTLFGSPTGDDPRYLANRTPRYYSLDLTPKYRATAIAVSERYGQLGRGTLHTDILTDDIGTLHTAIDDALAICKLPPELLVNEVQVTETVFRNAQQLARVSFDLAT